MNILNYISRFFKAQKSYHLDESETVVINGEEVTAYKSKHCIDENHILQDLTNEEVSFIEENLKKSNVILNAYIDYEYELIDAFDARLLDWALEQWRIDKSKDKLSKDAIINQIGIAFGQDLVDNLGFKWQIFTDKYGENYAVKHKEKELFAFPISSVNKAITENRKGSLYEIKLYLQYQLSLEE